MNDHHISKRLRQAVKTSASADEVTGLVEEALANEDSLCVGFLRTALDRAIRNKNNAAVKIILSKCSECQPRALRLLLSGANSRQPLLLVLAVQTGNVEALKLLLEFGANPNEGGVQFHFLQSPLRVAAVSPHSKPYHHHATIDAEDNSPPLSPTSAGCVKSVSYELIWQLLAFGANPLLHFVDGSGTIPLHFAPHLAVVCSDAAELLVHSTPPIGYDCRFDWPPGSVNSSGLTPLSMALFEASQATRQGRHVNKVFSSVILPLLRAGATLNPDPFSSPKTMADMMFLDAAVGSSLWQQHFMVVRLALEARWTSRFGAVEAKTLSSLKDSSGDNEAYVEFIRSLYPRRLDILCRSAILRSLPRGVAARQQAIDSLPLPKMLNNFLNFSEFEVPTSACGFYR